jgi:hypothetical protein
MMSRRIDFRIKTFLCDLVTGDGLEGRGLSEALLLVVAVEEGANAKKGWRGEETGMAVEVMLLVVSAL